MTGDFSSVVLVMDRDNGEMTFSIETRPPDQDPPPNSMGFTGSDGLSLGSHSVSQEDLSVLAPETQNSSLSSVVYETCPLPLTQGQGVNSVPETCPINFQTTPNPVGSGSSTLVIPETQETKASRIDNLLGAPIDAIPSSMVAPLLGSMYNGNNATPTGSNTINTRSPNNTKNFTPAVPKNFTLDSTGKRCIILIKPLSHNGRDLIYDPILTNELIYESSGPFSNQQKVKDLRINKVKGIITVEYSPTVPWSFIKGLTDVVHLGDYSVNCYIPNSDKFSTGTISPVSLRLTEEKVKQWLKTDPVEVVKVERLRKRKQNSDEWEDSETIKITFDSAQIPKGVSLCGSYYKTRVFVPFPVQCCNCQRLGHTSGSCKSKVRCRKCAGSHHKKDCTLTTMKCANCGGPHNANSRDCTVIQKAYKLEKDKVLGRNPNEVMRTAPVLTDRENWPNIPGQRDDQRKASEHPSLYSRAVAGSSDKIIKDSSTFAVNQKCTCTCVSNPSDILNREFFEKLKNFVLEIFSIISAGESSAAKSILASSAIRNNFGIDLTTSNHPDKNIKDNNDCDIRKKRPLNSTDEILSDEENPDGVLSENTSPLAKKESVAGGGARKSKKKKKNKGSNQ